MKTVFFDLETTGIEPQKAAVIQIGAILDVDGKEVDNLNIKLKPHLGAHVDQRALDVTGLTMEQLMYDEERLEFREGYWKFMEFCGFKPGQRVYTRHRIHRAGYNILGFDNSFLQILGERSGDQYTYAKFHWPGIDVASIACAALRGRRQDMQDFKLMTVASFMDIGVDGQAHDALFDVRVTRDLYYALMQEGF
jgi:DNA polymerase-3 subunit epsilon